MVPSHLAPSASSTLMGSRRPGKLAEGERELVAAGRLLPCQHQDRSAMASERHGPACPLGWEQAALQEGRGRRLATAQRREVGEAMTDRYHFVTLRVTTSEHPPDEPGPLGDGIVQLVVDGHMLEVEVVSSICEVTQGRTWPAP
jgi:hypothetical protein